MSNTRVPEISVIIAVRNDPENLAICLDALMKSDCRTFECIVIDDASTDSTPEIMSQHPVRALLQSKNRGPALCRNLGANAARGKILFFVDADVQVAPDTLTKICWTLREPGLDAVIGSYDDQPLHKNFISQYRNLFHHFVHQNLAGQTSTFWTGCGAIRKEVFIRLNGFRQAYRRPSIEDIELGMRLALQGGVIALRPDIQVKHLKRWSFWRMLKTDVRDRAIPWTALLFSLQTFPNDLNISASQRLYVSLVFLLVISLVLPFVFDLSAVGPLSFSAMLLLALLAGNRRVYRLFYQKKGLSFTAGAVILHLFYFFYSGISFVAGAMFHYFGKMRELSGFLNSRKISRPIEPKQRSEYV